MEDRIMKRMNKVFVLLAMAAVVFSCAKENPAKEEPVTPTEDQPAIQDLDPSKYLVGFGAAIEGTKVSISPDTGVMEFEEGDKALVVCGTDCGEYVYSVSDGSFSPVDASNAIPMASSGISVYYPYDAFELSSSDVIFKMPEYIKSLTDLGKNNPLAAQVVEDNVNGGFKATFKSVCSILQVSITGNRTLESVVLSNTGSKPFASGSEFTVTWSDNNPVITSESTGDTMTIDSSVTLSDTPTVFYFILPAGISFNGVAVTANMTTEDAGGSKSFTVTRGDWTPVRNKIFKMDFFAGLFSGGAGTAENPYKIANARDFKHIKTYTTDGYGTLSADHFLAAKYQQTADINFGADAEHKSDISAYMIGTSANPFTGKYDGNNYSLNYFSLSGTSPVGLFQHIGAATIDDVVVSGFSVSGQGKVGTIVGLVTGNAAATISNCETSNGTVSSTAGESGGVVGRVNVAGTKLTVCINRANVTNTTANNNVGGIVGYSSESITITRCDNFGTIINETGSAGGILGRNNNDCEFSGCSNSGPVTGTSYVGGIVGNLYPGGTIESCSNEGDVTGVQFVGGIAGAMGTTSGFAYIKKCRSNATITSSSNEGSSQAGGIVGTILSGVLNTCFAKGTVTAAGYDVGGIVGQMYCNNGTYGRQYVYDCLAAVDVSSSRSSGSGNVGGVAGRIVRNASYTNQYMALDNCIGLNQSITCNLQYTGALVGNINAGSTTNASYVRVRNCISLVEDSNYHANTTANRTGGFVGAYLGQLNDCYYLVATNNQTAVTDTPVASNLTKSDSATLTSSDFCSAHSSRATSYGLTVNSVNYKSTGWVIPAGCSYPVPKTLADLGEDYYK